MNRATLHAVLAALVDVGYLNRANDKSYTLGPALMRIAQAAKDNMLPLQIALRELALRFDAVCAAVFRVGDEMIVRERQCD